MRPLNLNIDVWKDVWLAQGLNIQPVPNSPMLEVNGVKGFLTPGDIEFMWNLGATLPKGGKYLEVGSWQGLSSIIVSYGLMSALNFDARVFCVDTWEGSVEHQSLDIIKSGDLYQTYLSNIRKAKVEHFITPKRGRSVDVANSFADGTFDVIFIDGDHSMRGCLADIEAYLPKVRKGGRLLGHDATDAPGGVRDAVKEFSRKTGLEYTITPSPKAFYIWEIFLQSFPN